MREVLDIAKPYSDAELKDFNVQFTAQVKTLKGQRDQQEIVRMVESHLLQLMDDFYAELDSYNDDNDLSLEEKLLSGQSIENLISGMPGGMTQQ